MTEITKTPEEYIVKREPITSGTEAGIMVSLVPAGIDIATLELRQEDGGLTYRDKDTDWQTCRCDFFNIATLRILALAGKRLLG